jgi:predicted phage-related endonuclease
MQSEADCQLLFSKGQAEKAMEASSKTVDLVHRFHTLSQQSEVCEEELSAIKTQIMAQMQDAEKLTYEGSVLATWKAPKPSYRIDTKRLQTEEAAIFDKYKVMNQASRRLVIKAISEKSPAIKTLEAA